MTYTIEQRAGFPTLIGPDTTRQATNAEVELIAERDALAQRCRDLEFSSACFEQSAAYWKKRFDEDTTEAIDLLKSERDALRAEVERLERIARHLVRVYVVDDQSYAPETATDVALARYKEQFK